MEVIILGCGEAFDEALPNTSVLVKTETLLLLDCGYSAPAQVWKETKDPGALDAIYLTHAHADHYFGLPALLGRMWEDGRTKPLTILSQAAVLEQIPQVMELGYRNLASRFGYPIEYRIIEPGKQLPFGDLLLDFAATRHSMSNLAIRIESEGKSVCYSGDGMFSEAGQELFRNADLLIHEAYSFSESPLHTDIDSLLEMAAGRNVGQLALVHVQRAVRRHPERILKALEQLENRAMMPGPMSRIEI